MDKVFYIWYSHGKPGSTGLLPLIPADLDEFGRLPTPRSLVQWIGAEFKPRAELLDEQIKRELEAQIVSEKIAMFKRHADVGLKMQDMAIQYLNENRDELSAPAAVRLLVEGIRIERESRGIPAALDKMLNMDDTQLMNEIQQLMEGAGVTLEGIDADS
jgi:hypothetical protein